MKYRSLILILVLAAMLPGCRKDEPGAKVEVTQDGTVKVEFSAGLSAKELAHLQTALTNDLGVKAERQEQWFEIAKLQVAAEVKKVESAERRFNAGVVSMAIVLLSAIACVFIVRKEAKK